MVGTSNESVPEMAIELGRHLLQPSYHLVFQSHLVVLHLPEPEKPDDY